MYNIIIFGTGSSCKIVESGLNTNTNIICYLDNNKKKWGKINNNREIKNPNEIKNMDYDYVVIASQYNNEIYTQLINLGVEESKILEFYMYFGLYYNHVAKRIYYMSTISEQVEAIATGISYMVNAIDVKILNHKTHSLANASQDLYYDYHTIKYILENFKDDYPKLKYLLIGLSYYSFEYDMSLSSMKTNVVLYYEAFKCKHHCTNVEELVNRRNKENIIGKNIFKFDDKDMAIFDWHIENTNIKNVINEEVGKRQALIDCNKNYPETVRENIEILKEYLQLLKENNIKPIIIVCPVSKYYSKYFDKRLKSEFYENINYIKKFYDFEVMDYFESDLFKDDDFYDVSHLNENGSRKFTKILNKQIKW